MAPSLAKTTIEFAGRRADLAARIAVQAAFATVSYRLEPQGRGSRFPIVMNRLYAGGVEPDEMLAAASELDTIAAELRALPPGRAISSLDNLGPFRARAPLVNDRAATLFDYFITLDGTPLIAALRSAVEQSRIAGVPLKLGSPEVVHQRKTVIWAIVLGVAWSAIGYLYFPNYVIVPTGSQSHSGPLAWPIGVPIAILGVAALFEKPGRGFRDSHQWIIASIGIVLAGLWLAFTWRS